MGRSCIFVFDRLDIPHYIYSMATSFKIFTVVLVCVTYYLKNFQNCTKAFQFDLGKVATFNLMINIRSVVRSLSNIYNGAFCKNSERLKTNHYFRKKVPS